MRVTTVATAALAGAAVTVGAVLIAGDGPAGTATAGAPASTATATAAITRRDLVETAIEDGALGYADMRSVVNRVPGTVTWLPPAGSVVRVDGTLYRIDDSPVILLSGRVPAYRPLGPGTSAGADVRQLEQSLRVAGYDPDREMAIDRSWNGATTAAVTRWQKAHGLPQSATIELGRVVFLPGPRRIAAISATLGGSSGGGEAPPPGAEARPGAPSGAGADGETILTTTSTSRRVSVALDTTRSALARRAARVSIELPSGKRVDGRISSIGKVAAATPAREAPAPSSSSVSATIEVKIRLLTARAGLDRAPVTVRFEKSRRRDVLAIPVTALMARPGGRFAVQLADARATPRVITVVPGLYADGYVEVAGAGLRVGRRITNAAVQ